MTKRKQPQSKTFPPWLPLLIVLLAVVVVVIIFTSSNNSKPIPTATAPDNYTELWAAELNKYGNGCNDIAPEAWDIDWIPGTGAQVNYSYSTQNGCTRIDKVHIGTANSEAQINSLLRKESLIILANQIIAEQLDWSNDIQLLNPKGNYDLEVLGDYLAYRLLEPVDQAVLWEMAPDDYPKDQWDRKITCDVFHQTNMLSLRTPPAVIAGGVAQLIQKYC